MKIQVKEVTAKEIKEAEVELYIQDFKATRRYLRQFLWDSAAEGHNTNKGYAHANCEACELALAVREALNG